MLGWIDLVKVKAFVSEMVTDAVKEALFILAIAALRLHWGN